MTDDEEKRNGTMTHVSHGFPPSSTIGLHLQCLALIRRVLHQRGLRPSEVEETLGEDEGATWMRLGKKVCGDACSMLKADKDYLRRFREGLRTLVNDNEARGHESTDWPADWRQAL